MVGFKDIVCRYRLDFLSEILSGTPEALERLDFPGSYERYIIGPEGLQ
jgi:hypothetical protein